MPKIPDVADRIEVLHEAKRNLECYVGCWDRKGRVEGSGGGRRATVPMDTIHGLGLRGRERAGRGAFAHGRAKGKGFRS
jgi:hypothetical protein